MEDDRELDRKFAEILVELDAFRHIMNEVFRTVLAHGLDPDPEIRRSLADKVLAQINAQLDAVKNRVSQLRRGQATH